MASQHEGLQFAVVALPPTQPCKTGCSQGAIGKHSKQQELTSAIPEVRSHRRHQAEHKQTWNPSALNQGASQSPLFSQNRLRNVAVSFLAPCKDGQAMSTSISFGTAHTATTPLLLDNGCGSLTTCRQDPDRMSSWRMLEEVSALR